MQLDVGDLIADDGRTVARVRAAATLGGEFMGVPPTGTHVEVQLTDIMSVHLGLQLHAIILRTLGEARAAATIRARYPREYFGWFLAGRLVELDPWLDTQLGPGHRHEMQARAAAMTPRELQAVAHEAERRHLDLPLEAT